MRVIFIVSLFIGFIYSKMISDTTNKLILDTKTNLMWQDDNYATIYNRTWNDAIDYCEELDKANFTDWRLPNINELNSITDDSKYDPALDSNFQLSTSTKYWSSTTYIDSDKDNAWYVDFNTSISSTAIKIGEYKTRCVRNF